MHDEVAQMGHELASKLTAQLILVDLLLEVTDGEAADLALQLAEELRKVGSIAYRLQVLGREGTRSQLPN